MIIRHFLLWARNACAADRADGLAALARAYLYSDLSPADRAEAETAMMAMLDDPSPLVRRALADALGGSPVAPPAIIVALTADQSDIASLVLRRSPLLSDDDLIDAVATGCSAMRCAVASRPHVSAAVAGALVAIGDLPSLVALADNPAAVMTPGVLHDLIDRFGADGALRAALTVRTDLPPAVRQRLAGATAAALTRFSVEAGWMRAARADRVARDGTERAALLLAGAQHAGDLVDHLLGRGELTPAFLLRALMSRADGFILAALSALSGLPEKRVDALLTDPATAGLVALYRRTGLPEPLETVFVAGLEQAAARPPSAEPEPALDLPLIRATIAAATALGAGGAALSLLRRFEADAARDQAARDAAVLADQAALALVMELSPELLMPPPPADDVGNVDLRALTSDAEEAEIVWPEPPARNAA